LYEYSIDEQLVNITFDGFDLTPQMIYNFKNWIDKNKINNIHLKEENVLNLSNLPINWNNYDFIITSGMLEYLSKNKLEVAINNLLNLLKQNGILLICITKDNYLNRFLIKKLWKANCYTKQELINILNNCKIDNFELKEFYWPYKYLNNWGFVIEIKKY